MSRQEGVKIKVMRNIFFFLIILTIGIVIKILTIQILPFDSDQAIVGLMESTFLTGPSPGFITATPTAGYWNLYWSPGPFFFSE